MQLLLRWAGVTLLAGFVLFCGLLLVVRHVALPQVASHRDDIARLISRELGRPVEIDAIDTGWDGWNPVIAVRGLRVRDAAGSPAQPAVEVGEVRGTISWTSILAADLRLRELAIDKPHLGLRRDVAGRVHVAGLDIEPRPGDDNASFIDWLLRQRLIVVRDALLTWDDEHRQAPQLLLDYVQLRLESRFGQHRFGLTGTPPPEVAAPIDLRGEFSSASLADWREGAGRLYLRLDYADVAAWSEWLPLPVTMTSGQGAMRAWFDFADGVARHVIADVELADVRTRLAPDLPSLDLAHVAGRVSWQQQGTKRSLAARGLRSVGRNGTAIQPTNVDLRYEVAASGGLGSGRMSATRVDLAALTALAAQLPLPAAMREDFARHAPRGTLTDVEYAWEGPLAAPSAFTTRATFSDVGIDAHQAMPGLAGVSGTLEATQAQGTLRLASRNAAVTMPGVFAEPLALDTASGRVRWERRADSLTVRFDDVRYANAHAAGTAQGTWKSRLKGPGEIDLTARLSRVDARNLHRYLPLAVGEPTRAWLRDSLLAGRAEDARLTLKGDLSRFPFAADRSGTFTVTVKATDATLDYAHGWPRISGVDADVRIEGHALTVVASKGQVLGTSLGRTTATIPDLSVRHPVLAIEGEAAGPTSQFLQFIAQSPVAGWIDRRTDGVQASGDGRLALRLAMRLGDPDAVAQVAGEYQFVDNVLRMPGVPALSRATGELAFTERDLSGRDLAFETLGGAARASLSSKDGALRVTGSGTADLASVHGEFGTPFAERFTGATDWQLDLALRGQEAAWTLRSSLRGAAVDLPGPLGKPPESEVPLRIERRPADGDKRETLTVDYGSIGRMLVHRKPGSADPQIERVAVLLGKAAAGRTGEPGRPGISVRGDVGSIDVDEWLAFAKTAAARDPQRERDQPLALAGIDIEAGEFVVFGRRYGAMSLSARPAGEGWRMKFASRQAEGSASWEPAGSKLANGRFAAKLDRLDITRVEEMRTQAEPARPGTPRSEGSANPWPEVDIVAERFVARAGDLGRMQFSARPEGTDWRVTRFALVNEAGRIDADGWWRLVGRQQSTSFDVRIDVDDAGAFLARMGLPGGISAAPAKLQGRLSWPGTPTDFAYDALSGKFSIDVGAGQFTKLDPGMGKLLGVLSLQALPRRISLDFRDVFSEGFAFDKVTGSASIASGIMTTDNLALSGPAAKVHLAGDVDLKHETQQLSVRVQPSLSTAVSTGAGAAAVALLAANPLVGAAVGAGTLIAQKIMQDPIEQMFSYEYAVRGSWSEPVVERLAARPVQRFGEALKLGGGAR